ncbi:MAG: hypothetical protein KFF49_08685 [Bacteroidales bacterium]|nr:hypothetical protein [Bacteroidales bacterium]
MKNLTQILVAIFIMAFIMSCKKDKDDLGDASLQALHDPILEVQFDDDPYNHNMHIASDGSYYYTVNGGNFTSGMINKYTLEGQFIDSYDIELDFRSIMYNDADGYFYACGFESDYLGNIYKITSIENGTFQILYTDLYEYAQSSTALSLDGQYIYAFNSGTLKKYNLSDGTLVETLTGLNCGIGNYGGDGAVAVDPDYIYTWNAGTRTVYVYNHSGTLVRTMTLDYGNNGNSLSFVDGYLFVSVDADYAIGTWYGYNIRKAVNQPKSSIITKTSDLPSGDITYRPDFDSTNK